MFGLRTIHPWLVSAEDDEAWGPDTPKKKVTESPSPEQQTHENNKRILCDVLGYMLYPPSPFSMDTAELKRGIVSYYESPGEPPTKQLQKGQYPWNTDDQLSRALDRYFRGFRETQQFSAAQEEKNLCRMPLDMKNLIVESCEIAKWPYKLGAALYLHQQMAVREKTTEPSQSKAQWLVANAPIKQVAVNGESQLRPDGGQLARIGDQWNKYYVVAHYWAAFVVWAKTPLNYPVDGYALIDFVCNADPDEFLAHAAAFRKFRADVPIARTKVMPFMRKDADRLDEFLDDVVPTPQLSIPDLLDSYQWEALQKYKTPVRPSRLTTSQRN